MVVGSIWKHKSSGESCVIEEIHQRRSLETGTLKPSGYVTVSLGIGQTFEVKATSLVHSFEDKLR